tara:strand:+ start:162 stop:650 length:489 start_codon:yes stop_codon:yes gene_type:complete
MIWIVVQTKSSNEYKAKVNLIRQGYEVFYPKINKSVHSFNRVKTMIKPLFPGYIFVNLKKNQNWVRINSTFGVKTILKIGEKIYELPIEIINSIKLKCNNEEICNVLPINTGDKVKILSKKFPGLNAIFSEYIDEKRSFVLIDLLMRKIKTKVLNNDIEAII